MSKLLPIKTSARNRRLDWINGIVHLHNLVCGCDKPLEHTLEEIYTQEPQLHPYNKICPTTTKDHATTGLEELGDGDLERLFDEDFGEENTTTDAASTSG